MTKKIEIELPEMTEAEAERFERDSKCQWVSGIYEVANSCGLDVTEYYIALKHGYTIKKEPKYYIHLLKGDNGYFNLKIVGNTIGIANKHTVSPYQTQFTESEIKTLDPRYWEFRELVEDEA